MTEEAGWRLYRRITQLQKDITEVLQLRLPGGSGIGEGQYGDMYNGLLAEAEKLTKVKPPLSKAPGRGDAGSNIGVLIVLKALTGQLAQWLQDEAGLEDVGVVLL